MKKRTITKTIKIDGISKSYDMAVTTWSYYNVAGTTSGYYRVMINNNRQNRTLEKDIDKKIKNIRIVYEFEQEILDDAEKEYLSNVIKPFRNKVAYIQKCGTSDGDEYIWIELENDYVSLPYFKKGTMYRGMEVDKKYTLEELGL